MQDLGLDKILAGIKVDGASPYATAEKESWNEVEIWIPSGCVSFDYAVGGYKRGLKGGIPIGKCMEINGFESTAKSSFLDLIMKNTLLVGAVFLCDPEHSHSAERMAGFGCDMTNLRFIEKPRALQNLEKELEEDSEEEAPEETKGGKKKKKSKKPKSLDIILEEFFDLSEKTLLTIRSKIPAEVPILWALDSLAAIKTKMQSEATDPSNQRVQLDKSQVMEQRFGDLCKLITNMNGSLILVNQLRNQPGVIYGNPERTPGGDGKNYLFSLRVRMAKAQKITVKDAVMLPDQEERLPEDIVGIQAKGEFVKNKLGEPFREFRFPFFFNAGIPHQWCFAQMVIDRQKWLFPGDLEKDGNTFIWKGEKLGVGEGGLTKAFLENPMLLEEMEEELFG